MWFYWVEIANNLGWSRAIFDLSTRSKTVLTNPSEHHHRIVQGRCLQVCRGVEQTHIQQGLCVQAIPCLKPNSWLMCTRHLTSCEKVVRPQLRPQPPFL